MKNHMMIKTGSRYVITKFVGALVSLFILDEAKKTKSWITKDRDSSAKWAKKVFYNTSKGNTRCVGPEKQAMFPIYEAGEKKYRA
jgi:hypothetical protein